ncbi:MAG: hypothetical protein HGA38_01695 [Candidatus Moranbacteria bacterium]|nr:hypothetical protein [Candidatus Moranbacteria bacterium]
MMLTLHTVRNSKQALRNGTFRVAFVSLLAVVTGLSGGMSGTNAFFSDTESVTGNSVEAGVWIPTLHASVSPASPNGQYDATLYKTRPCVTLSYDGLSSGTATIWYEFSDDGDPRDGGTVYGGACIEVPDGDSVPFQAVAVNDANPAWKSTVLSRRLRVDTECPEITLKDPDDGDTVSGNVKLRGTLSDKHPHHYWLVVVKKSNGEQVAGPGVVNDSDSFSDKILYDWDTTKVVDGDYVVKFEARDAAGNKCEPGKSVDWNTVTVRNAVPVTEAGNMDANPGDVTVSTPVSSPSALTVDGTGLDGVSATGDPGTAEVVVIESDQRQVSGAETEEIRSEGTDVSGSGGSGA